MFWLFSGPLKIRRKRQNAKPRCPKKIRIRIFLRRQAARLPKKRSKKKKPISLTTLKISKKTRPSWSWKKKLTRRKTATRISSMRSLRLALKSLPLNPERTTLTQSLFPLTPPWHLKKATIWRPSRSSNRKKKRLRTPKLTKLRPKPRRFLTPKPAVTALWTLVSKYADHPPKPVTPSARSARVLTVDEVASVAAGADAASRAANRRTFRSSAIC